MVLGQGPKNPKLVWIGETPGPDEVRQGRPFVGASGMEVRSALRAFGVPEISVFFDNTCPEMVLPFPKGMAGVDTLLKYNDHLPNSKVWQSPGAKVIVACGTWALRRLLAHRMQSITLPRLTINNWHGSVIRWTAADKELAESNKLFEPIDIPIGSVIIPVLHPASWAGRRPRDPSRTMRPVFLRFVERACKYARGLYTMDDVYTLPPVGEGGTDNIPDSDVYYIDFEFTPKPVHDVYGIRRPWLLGVSCGPDEPVYQTEDLREMRRFIVRAFVHNNARFVAQNTIADIRPARYLLGDANWFPRRYDDLMLLHAVMQPDLDHNLSFISRYYVHNVREWKWLVKHDQYIYNRFDVDMLAKAFVAGMAEAEHVPHEPLEPYSEFMRSLPKVMDIEDIGMRVDKQEVIRLKREQLARIDEARNTIEKHVTAAISERLDALHADVTKLKTSIDDTLRLASEQAIELAKDCPNPHKPYKMTTKPKCEFCLKIYNDTVVLARSMLKDTKKLLTKNKKLHADISEKGFRVGNDNDTRWYISTVLGKTTKSKTATGLMQVSERYLEKFSDDPVIGSILDAKHAQKLISTFLSVLVDSNSYAHPPIMLHGTASGRPSSGRESKGDTDKVGDQVGAFNAFNIPKAVRSIYVPDPGHTFVMGDYSDLEGRIMALYTGDATLCQLYAQGTDVHKYVAAICFKDSGVTYENARDIEITYGTVAHSARYLAKRVAHGKRYGMGVRELARQLRIPVKEAKRISQAIDELFPTIKAANEELLDMIFGKWEVAPGGQFRCVKPALRYHVTTYNRIRYYPGIRGAVQKEAISQEPQSDGAHVWHELINNVCMPFSARLRRFDGRLVIGTYDSVALSVKAEEADECAAWLKTVAERPDKKLSELPGAKLMPVSIPFEITIGEHYGLS